jgi:hypothetical protein
MYQFMWALRGALLRRPSGATSSNLKLSRRLGDPRLETAQSRPVILALLSQW